VLRSTLGRTDNSSPSWNEVVSSSYLRNGSQSSPSACACNIDSSHVGQDISPRRRKDRSFQAADLAEPYWRVQLATAAEAQRGPQSPNRLLRIGIKAAFPVARPVLGRTVLSRRSPVLCRGSLDDLPCSAGRPRCSLTCPINAASLPFLNKNGNEKGQFGAYIITALLAPHP
jgi:hypothetical protein